MDEVEKITKEKIIKVKKNVKPEHPFIFSLQGGRSYLYLDLKVSGVPSKVADKYVNGLKNGFLLGANCHYLLTNSLGIGADYSFFRSATKIEF
jgi:hypothetical protein